MQDPYGVLADDRINDKIDFSKINSKQDYIRAVTEYLSKTISGYHGTRQGKRLIPYIEKMFENSKAKDIVEEKQRQLKEFLKKKKPVKVVKKKPRYKKRVAPKIKKAEMFITKRDRKIEKTIGVRAEVYVFGKRYRDLNTGRFTKKPY